MVRALTWEDRAYLRELLADDDDDPEGEGPDEDDPEESPDEDDPEESPDEDDVISYQGHQYRRVTKQPAAKRPAAKRPAARTAKKTSGGKTPPKKAVAPVIPDPTPSKRRLFT